MDLGIPGLGDAVEIGRTPAITTYRSLESDGRVVVVKVLARPADPAVWARFDYDQSKLRELDGHPNVVPVLRHGVTPDNHPFVVVDHVPGGSFADRTRAGLDGLGVVSVGVRLAGALESAHRRGVVHGDLRPEDIFVDERNEPQMTDFGLAMASGWGPDRATEPERIAHAAPEQLASHLPSASSDIYALGSVLYSLLANAPAFVRPGDVGVVAVGARITNEAPPSLATLGVPDAVADIVGRAMAKQPADRFSSAEAMGIALQQAEVALGSPLTPMIVSGPPPADDAVAAPPIDHAPPPETPPPPYVPGQPPVVQQFVEPAAGAGRSGSKLPLIIGLVVVAAVVVVVLALVLGGGGEDRDPIVDAVRTGYSMLRPT